MIRVVRNTRLLATGVVLIAASASAQSTPKSKQGTTKSTQPAPKSARSSTKASDVAKNAPQPKGLQTRVWVNRDTKVYHCPAGLYYGKTRNGEFMEEAQARAFGNRAVQGQGCPDVATNGPAPLPFTTNAARRMVWVNTESGLPLPQFRRLGRNPARPLPHRVRRIRGRTQTGIGKGLQRALI